MERGWGDIVKPGPVYAAEGYEAVMLFKFVQHKVGVGLSFCLRIESVCHGGIRGSIPNPIKDHYFEQTGRNQELQY